VSCRDEVAATLAELQDRTGQQVFTVREVCGEMLAAGTSYAESTVFTTMQRMKAQAGRAPWIILEQTGGGFRLPTQTYGPTYRAGEGTARCLFRLVKARGQAVG
jgi:hypothetical protein